MSDPTMPTLHSVDGHPERVYVLELPPGDVPANIIMKCVQQLADAMPNARVLVLAPGMKFRYLSPHYVRRRLADGTEEEIGFATREDLEAHVAARRESPEVASSDDPVARDVRNAFTLCDLLEWLDRDPVGTPSRRLASRVLKEQGNHAGDIFAAVRKVLDEEQLATDEAEASAPFVRRNAVPGTVFEAISLNAMKLVFPCPLTPPAGLEHDDPRREFIQPDEKGNPVLAAVPDGQGGYYNLTHPRHDAARHDNALALEKEGLFVRVREYPDGHVRWHMTPASPQPPAGLEHDDPLREFMLEKKGLLVPVPDAAPPSCLSGHPAGRVSYRFKVVPFDQLDRDRDLIEKATHPPFKVVPLNQQVLASQVGYKVLPPDSPAPPGVKVQTSVPAADSPEAPVRRPGPDCPRGHELLVGMCRPEFCGCHCPRCQEECAAPHHSLPDETILRPARRS